VEVLLVLVILVMIGSLAVVQYGNIQEKAQIKAAKAEIEVLENALRLYRLDVSTYPATDAGLEALSQAPGDTDKWQGPYLEQDSLQDPWGRPYQYQFPGQYSEDKPDIWSLGPDGEDGSEDDVGNWTEG
jgi:general secretion pathway protein G